MSFLFNTLFALCFLFISTLAFIPSTPVSFGCIDRVTPHKARTTALSAVKERTAASGKQEQAQERVGISEDDPMVQRIREDVRRETGVDLDQLLNPSKVVNLEFELINLRNERDAATQGGGKALAKLEAQIEKKETQLATEKRLVMRGWLKNLFLGQSLLAVVLSGVVAYDALPGVEHLPLPIRAFAFWSFWMFTIPSLRARRPGAVEKKALDVAFLLTPVVSLGMPFLTQDVPTIWWANAVATGASYGYAFAFQGKGERGEGEEGGSEEDETLPGPLKAALKALDWGSGRERGVRK
ncbi:hypothetical protein NSK_003659 [Nannochloropsis salina CCMP1776]|jgi:hypothetical protein|uniref:Uncharacterized protein n=1 Tax=Nannochloropsis salina CCMP1776 TaxID=1027361 RepID=A0A4D9D1G9_9STRA|nr:hypothetical protein NSK_003659 [Nannochloropsis salina CCMP1776]|eukprot:TFJ85236.1 hypothetical protein NSK_003659 [Nannochloropsis salina CCMP1776]